MNSLRHSESWIYAACVTLLLGRSWQYWFWDTAFHATFPAMEIIAGSLFLATLAGLLFFRKKRWVSLVLLASSVVFAGQFLLAFPQKEYQWAYLVEHSLAILTPVICLLWTSNPKAATPLAQWATALTFWGHGVYALGGPYPTPSHFLFMTTEVMGISPESAVHFLRFAGFMDLAVVAALIFPGPAKGLLLYAACWGMATALARPWAYVSLSTLGEDLHRWAMEAVFRVPHSLVPLAIWIRTSWEEGNRPN